MFRPGHRLLLSAGLGIRWSGLSYVWWKTEVNLLGVDKCNLFVFPIIAFNPVLLLLSTSHSCILHSIWCYLINSHFLTFTFVSLIKTDIEIKKRYGHAKPDQKAGTPDVIQYAWAWPISALLQHKYCEIIF